MRYAFFALKPEDIETHYKNWFYVTDYQSLFPLSKALYDIDNTYRTSLDFFMSSVSTPHVFIEEPEDEFATPKMYSFDTYNIMRIDEEILREFKDAIDGGPMYQDDLIFDADEQYEEKLAKLTKYRTIDSMMCENLLSFINKGFYIFVRRYSDGTYDEENMSSMEERLLSYIDLNTRVNNTTSDIPSNSGMMILATIVAHALSECGCDVKTYTGNMYIVSALLSSNTDIIIPKICFTSHVDSHNYLDEDNYNPEINHLLDQLYADRGIDLYDKPYTQAELDRWYREGVIVSSNDNTGLGIKGKTGVVEILGMLEYLKAHPEIPHGDILILITTDAELGKSFDNAQNISELEDTKIVYFVEGEGLNTVQYSNYNISRLKFCFSGSKFLSENINACKSVCTLVNELYYGAYANNIKEFDIINLNGTSSYAELLLEIKDMNNDSLNDRIRYVITALKSLNSSIPSNTVTYTNSKLSSNISSHIPQSMINLASDANKAIYNRTIVNSILNTYGDASNVITLVSKGYPSIVLSNGVFNAYKPTECIPIPAMTRCRDVLINIIKLSSTHTFDDI